MAKQLTSSDQLEQVALAKAKFRTKAWAVVFFCFGVLVTVFSIGAGEVSFTSVALAGILIVTGCTQFFKAHAATATAGVPDAHRLDR